MCYILLILGIFLIASTLYMIFKKEKTKETPLEKALKTFSSGGFYNFEIELNQNYDHLLAKINEKGEVSLYVKRELKFIEVKFSDNENGSNLRNTFIKMFIHAVEKDKILVTDYIYSRVNGTIIIRYENNETYFKRSVYTGKPDLIEENKQQQNRYNSNYNSKSSNRSESELQILCNSFKLPVSSSYDDFKKKYRQLCKKYHPDVFGSDDMMKKINITFERVEIYFGKK